MGALAGLVETGVEVRRCFEIYHGGLREATRGLFCVDWHWKPWLGGMRVSRDRALEGSRRYGARGAASSAALGDVGCSIEGAESFVIAQGSQEGVRVRRLGRSRGESELESSVGSLAILERRASQFGGPLRFRGPRAHPSRSGVSRARRRHFRFVRGPSRCCRGGSRG